MSESAHDVWQSARLAAVKSQDTRTLSRLSHPAVREAVQRGNVAEVSTLVGMLTPGEQSAPLTAKDLAAARVDDPEAYREATQAFAGRFFAHHDERARSFWDGLTDADKARLGKPAS